MATICFRAYQGKVCIWEKPASGDPMAPFNNPTAHMDLVRFHSDLQYLSNSIVTDVTISHTSLAGVVGTGYTISNAGGSSGASQPITNGQIRSTTINLYQHSLGFPPLYFVLYNNQLVCPFFPVQAFEDRLRTVSPSTTNNYIRLREIAESSDVALPAVSRTYRVIVFREPVAVVGQPLFRATTNSVVMGHGKVNSDYRNIRKATTGFDFYVPTTPILDTRNGAVKIISATGEETTTGQYTGSFFEIETIKVSY